MGKWAVARGAGLVCLAGAVLQIGYGLLAVVFPYPEITRVGFELLWALANVGMIGGVIGWLALDVARPHRAAIVGGALAALGYLIRIAISVVLVVRPSATVDAPIVGSILLMFLGVGVVGVGTLRGRRLAGWRAWVPLLTVAAGLLTAVFYSIDRVIHFVFLGLVWGPAWLLVGYLVVAHADIGEPVAPRASSKDTRQPRAGACS